MKHLKFWVTVAVLSISLSLLVFGGCYSPPKTTYHYKNPHTNTSKPRIKGLISAEEIDFSKQSSTKEQDAGLPVIKPPEEPSLIAQSFVKDAEKPPDEIDAGVDIEGEETEKLEKIREEHREKIKEEQAEEKRLARLIVLCQGKASPWNTLRGVVIKQLKKNAYYPNSVSLKCEKPAEVEGGWEVRCRMGGKNAFGTRRVSFEHFYFTKCRISRYDEDEEDYTLIWFRKTERCKKCVLAGY